MPNRLRTKSYVIFIDFRKAFDKVPRHILIEAMIAKGIIPTLVEAFRQILSDTSMQINSNIIHTDKGVPQGAVTSPTLFNIF